MLIDSYTYNFGTHEFQVFQGEETPKQTISFDEAYISKASIEDNSITLNLGYMGNNSGTVVITLGEKPQFTFDSFLNIEADIDADVIQEFIDTLNDSGLLED